MEAGELDPEYVDKGRIDPEKLVEIYSDFGLQMDYNEKPKRQITKLEEQFGDITSEILYLNKIGAVEYSENKSVTLETSERKIARRLSQRVFRDKEKPSEVVESGDIAHHLEEPDSSEDYNKPIDCIDQEVNDELYTRIIDILSNGEALTAEEVEEELAVDVNFDLEPKLRNMERKGAAARVEEDRYRLLPENIDESFFGEELNLEGQLRDQQRHGNDPWKP